jgi:transposase
VLKATVLVAMHSIRPERAFYEGLSYDLLFKWFLDLPIDARRRTTAHHRRDGTPSSPR